MKADGLKSLNFPHRIKEKQIEMQADILKF